jgi:hypothetical protein
MRRNMLFVVFIGLAFWGMAQDISLQNSPPALRILPGTPAEFELMVGNTSGKPLVLVGTTLKSALAEGGLPGGTLYDSSGKALSCSGMSGGLVVKGNKPPCETPTVVFPAGGEVIMHCGIYSQRSCPLRGVPPGNYTGKVIIEAQACEGGQARIIRQTLEIPVTVEAPQGEDAAYLQCLDKAVNEAPPKFSGPYQGALKWMEVSDSARVQSQQIALSQYPTSTYAAYVVYETSGAKGLMSSDPAYVCQSIAEGSFLSSGSVPDDTGKCKDGWQSLTMEGVLKWREKWFSIVLKNHPDIWFADELRLKKAVDQIALKNYQAGAADLEQLCSNAKPDVAKKARQYLGLIKQKGWIKE